MRGIMRIVTIAIAFLLPIPSPAHAEWKESILKSLNGGDAGPDLARRQGVILGLGGKIYGTATWGGNFGFGYAFELIPPASGNTIWKLVVIHSFKSSFNGIDGSAPAGGLVIDTKGNLYGTTIGGSATSQGTVFKLSPPALGDTNWKETVLHSFGPSTPGGFDCPLGVYPTSTLVLDPTGSLFGTTTRCGTLNTSSFGTVFRLDPPNSGSTKWTASLVHSFDDGTDSGPPSSTLALDSDGNLYGTSGGSVFKLIRPSTVSETWKNQTLFSFNGENGASPNGVIIDKSRNLYGTTYSGGLNALGTAFKLRPPLPGKTRWRLTTQELVFSIGFHPTGTLTLDGAGNMYGTAQSGGTLGLGTVFKLTPTTSGPLPWAMERLYSFENRPDGIAPESNVVFDKSGRLYRTTRSGGSRDYGVVFRLTP